jgi:hypothetical protein
VQALSIHAVRYRAAARSCRVGCSIFPERLRHLLLQAMVGLCIARRKVKGNDPLRLGQSR